MKTMFTKKTFITILVTPFLSYIALSAEPEIDTKNKEAAVQPKVQIAILLDTSSSMNGLIDQAKTQLWKIVNEFAKVEKNQQVPTVEVALYEYGNSTLSVSDHYIRQLSPLTTELDLISEHLFSLKTNGGEEYCGAVIKKSLEELKWDNSSGVYKAIFIAGNEAFTQGPISAVSHCQAAIQSGIVINTIHCGDAKQGINGSWKAGAIAAEGDFLTIDQDKAIVHIEAPQDKIIIKLSSELNTTYLPYGHSGRKNLIKQTAQDNNAIVEAKKGAAINRALCKGSSIYNNNKWDLVDHCEQNNYNLEKIDKKHLPQELQKLSNKEIIAHVKKQQTLRTEIKHKIAKANQERISYLAKQKKVLSDKNTTDTLDTAISKAILKQAIKQGFTKK